jgi:AraC-like DNA-binding protein
VYAEVRRTGAGLALQISHSHAELEFNFVLSGRGSYLLDDGQYELQPGTLVWLLPHQPHRLIRSPDFDMWVVTLPPDIVDQQFLDEIAQCRIRLLSREDAIALDRLLTHVSQDSDDSELYRSGLDYAMRSARRLSMSSAGPSRKPLHPAVRKALMLLRSSDEVPTAGALAKSCGVTQDYLSRLITEQTGRGLVEWRNRTRLERFHVLYPDSEDLLTAALAAGFGSYTQFHRVFVELIGTTPGEWAKSGPRASTVALPSASKVLSGVADSGTSRMIWYPLAELAMPSACRSLGKPFSAAFLAADTAPPSAPPFYSFVDEYASLRAFEQPLVTEVAEVDEASARLLERAFTRNDVFASFEGTLGAYRMGIQDLGGLLAMYIAVASAAANHAPPLPEPPLLMSLRDRVRAALSRTPAAETAGAEQRSLATAAIVAQTIFLRHAIYSAHSSGSDQAVKRVAEAARRTGAVTLGIDFTAEGWAPARQEPKAV